MQADLFGPTSVSQVNPNSAPKIDFLGRTRITLRLDQGLILLIALLMVYVLIFSFGVEKGKRFAMAELTAERVKHEQMIRELRDKIFVSPATEGTETVSATEDSAQGTISKAVPFSAPETSITSAALTPASERPSGKFTIQILTATSQVAAERAMKNFSINGHQPFVIPSGKFQQICLDAFEARSKAIRVLNTLKAQGLVPRDAYVRPMPPSS